jgi:DNA-binding SARP family transcriptional activator
MTTVTRSTQIALFGALEVTHGQAAPQRPPTQKVLSLLGYLIAQHDVPQGRDKLVDLLWPDVLPRQGRRMLSDTLWRARRLLTPPGADDTAVLIIAGDTVTFRPDADTWVDVIAFECSLPAPTEAADERQIATMRSAIALYRGDFLEDCYDDWALYERERLRERYLGVSRQLLSHYFAARAYDAGLQMALQLVRADPLREDAHRDLMRLYYLLGREADALRAYEQCCKVLDQELGVEPDPETLSLYEEIVALQRRRAWERAHTGGATATALPIGPAVARDLPFVGRQEQRAEIMDAVELAIAGDGGMLLVAGMAGIGKSRLLREVAAGAEWRGAQVSWGHGREDAQALPFGALREALATALTPVRARGLALLLAPHTLSVLVLLLPQLAELLPGVSPHAPQLGERQAATFHAAIADALRALGQLAPQLIVLEDMHWFDPATLEALGVLLPALRGARVLVLISGRADELPQRPTAWNALLRLDRTGMLRRIELAGLSEADCADLVRRALRMRQPAPRFSARLNQATDGNPFFILETLRSLQEQNMLTCDERGVWHTPLDGPDSDYSDLPLPTGLRETIDVRLRELAPQERAALAAAAVLGQTFAPTTWAEVIREDAPPAISPAQPAAEKLPAPRAAGQWSSVVEQLLRRQFLVEDSTGYRFSHETLREVIYGDLDEQTRQSLHLRAAEALEQEHYARVEALAQHLYLAGAWQKALAYLAQAGERAQEVCAYRDAFRCYDQALDAATRAGADTVDAALLWNIQLKCGEVATLLGDYASATVTYEALLELAEREGVAPAGKAQAGARRSAQIQALNGLGYIYGLRNDYTRARSFIRRATTLASASPRLLDRAEVTYQAGLLSYRVDDYAEARRFLGDAMRLYERLGRDTEQAKCLLEIGSSYLRQDGPTDQVLDHYAQALGLYQRQDDRFGEHLCLLEIANAQLMRGKLVEVTQAIATCLPFFSSISAQDSVSWCLFLRGEAYRRLGRLDEAIMALRESCTICESLDHNAAAEFNRVCIAATLRDMADYDAALAALERPLHTDDRMIKLRALLVAADLWRIQSQSGRAWGCLVDGLALAQQLGSKACCGIAYRLLAQLRSADRAQQLPPPSATTPDSEGSFAESARLLQAAHHDDELALTYAAYGHYLLDSQRPAEAKAALVQARDLMRLCGIADALAAIEQLLARLKEPATPLRPGQRRALLARRGVPRGRPLRPDELVEVAWTVELPEQHEAGGASNKVVARQERLRRLCAEAAAQGAEPTVGDLAGVLGVAARTVDRDIARLRAAGVFLATRGTA